MHLVSKPLAPRYLAAIALTFLATACSEPMVSEAPAPLTAADARTGVTAEAVSVEPSIMPGPPLPPVRHPQARAGVLTAGDIDDTLNLAAFSRYAAKAARRLSLPRENLSNPIQLRLVGSDGKPASGVYLTLRRPGAGDPFFTGYSGVDGRVTVFPSLHGSRALRRVELRVPGSGQPGTSYRLDTGGGLRTVTLDGMRSQTPNFLDLAFVVDTTGSMGDELDWLARDITRIVSNARRSAPGVNIRYGLVLYRDRGDAYVVRNLGFTNQLSVMQSWLRNQTANGGGDYPEAAAEALQSAVALNWRRGQGKRLLFHVADAPPHKRQARAYLNAAKTAARNNIQIFGLGASGVGPESELLMRQASAMTQGRYLFLTDDSGVGNSHAEPTIACYQVTKLTDLMIRVLRSELTGRRIEASKGAVIRKVGAYRNGVCLN
ncbi:vWA domain-containing protein [Halovulum sp. GXIMD14793]